MRTLGFLRMGMFYGSSLDVISPLCKFDGSDSLIAGSDIYLLSFHSTVTACWFLPSLPDRPQKQYLVE